MKKIYWALILIVLVIATAIISIVIYEEMNPRRRVVYTSTKATQANTQPAEKVKFYEEPDFVKTNNDAQVNKQNTNEIKESLGEKENSYSLTTCDIEIMSGSTQMSTLSQKDVEKLALQTVKSEILNCILNSYKTEEMIQHSSDITFQIYGDLYVQDSYKENNKWILYIGHDDIDFDYKDKINFIKFEFFNSERYSIKYYDIYYLLVEEVIEDELK
jgi:hypothetical protein